MCRWIHEEIKHSNKTHHGEIYGVFFVVFITVQQVCALAALTVRKHKLEGKNPIGAADLEWIFACNYEGTE